jgi:hypothetical protein
MKQGHWMLRAAWGKLVDQYAETRQIWKAGEAPPRCAQIGEALLIWGGIRAALLLFGGISQLLLPLHPGSRPGPFPGNPFLDGWFRWDAGWYLGIAANGYWMDPRTHNGSVAFFPLFPIIVRIVGLVIGSLPLAGLVVSHIAFLTASVFFYALVQGMFNRDVARRALILLNTFPYSFFFSAVYTESLFLCLAVLSFWLAERKKWWQSGAVGLLCALTRSIGIALAPALTMVYLQQKGFCWRQIQKDVLSIALVPLGSSLYMAYLLVRFGDPLAFAKASLLAWGRYDILTSGLGRLDPTSFVPGDYDLVLALNLAVTILWLAAVIPTWRLLGPGYAVFVFLGAAIPLASQLESLGRFMAVLFPVFIVGGYYLRHPRVFELVVSGSAALLGLLTALFVNWYWVV